jgi:hypothetical protein
MTESNKIKRDIQDVFDDIRENNNRIEEIEEELIEMKEELKNRKKLQPGFKEELKSLKKDLLKEKKLEWVECDLNEWRKYVEDNFYDPVKYYVYRYDGGIRQQGFYKGECKLNVEDEGHFLEYFNDYFYYGSPNYQDENHPNADGSECYLAFGGGAASVQSFEWD